MIFSKNRIIVIAAMVVCTAAVVPSEGPNGFVLASAPSPAFDASAANLRAVQMTLYSYGYSVKVTGKADPRTARAISHWQQVNGLAVTGDVNAATLKSLKLVDTATLPPAQQQASSKAPAPPRASWTSPHPEVQRWYSTAISVGWQDGEWPKLACIIWRESGGQPQVANSAGAVGLTQILYAAHASWLGGVGPEQLKNPSTNLRIARRLYEAAGWSPWYYPPKPC